MTSRESASGATGPENETPRPSAEASSTPHALVVAPIRPRERLVLVLAAWTMILLGQPGLGRPDGFGHWAFVALAPWGLACSRPGRRAFAIEWFAASLGLAGFAFWMRHLFVWVVVPMGAVPALYLACAGIFLRHLARRFPLAIAVPMAWMPAELVRWHLNAPFSFGWWRLGTMAHDCEWMRGSARVWGTWGLTYVFAAFGGWMADLWRARKLPFGTPWPHRPRTIHLAGLMPLVLCMAFTITVAPPRTEPGPNVLIVQPGITQRVKSFSPDRFGDLFSDLCRLTAQGISEGRAAGLGEPDLVAWGESMYPWSILEPGVPEAFARGARPLEWARWDPHPSFFEAMPAFEEAMIGGVVFGHPGVVRAFTYPLRPDSGWIVDRLRSTGEPWAEAALAGSALLPAGTSFVSGVNAVLERDGHIRRQNSVVLWGPNGARVGFAGKVHLVPGAEDPRGFQHWKWLMDVMESEGGYVPDFVPVREAAVMPIETRDGRRFRIGFSICYDNAFDDPYTVPLRREPVDLFLVASNEDWYRESVEMDHMMAFTRLIAIATGRSVARVTNSGISAVIDPDGDEVGRIEVDGRSKLVRGTLLARIPVPAEDGPEGAPTTFFVRTERAQLVLWWALIVTCGILARRPRAGSVTTGEDPGKTPRGQR